MQVVLIILSLGLLGLIIYFAVSPKSSRLLRIAALIALGIIGLSIIIAGFFLIRGPVEPEVVIPFPVFEDASPQPVKNTNLIVTIIFLAALLLILGATTYISLKGQKDKPKEQDKKDTSSGDNLDLFGPAGVSMRNNDPGFADSDELDKVLNDDDESFDIDIDE